MMRRSEYATIMAPLLAIAVGDCDESTITAYYVTLCDMEPVALKYAVSRHLAESQDRWLPSPGRLRALAQEQAHGQISPSAEAFERVTQAVRKHGIYDAVAGLASLDELSARALNGCGGWEWACELSSDNRQTFAAQFRRAYEGLAERETKHRSLPEELRPKIGQQRALPAGVRRLADRVGKAVGD